MGGGVYGEQLLFFPELLESYTVFKMPAKVGAGYGEAYDKREVTGYFSRNRGGNMGIVSSNRVENDDATFWVEGEEDGKGIIQQGDYVMADGDLFVFYHDDCFSREGVFFVYHLRLVPAFTGQQKPDRNVDLAADFK
jgi:hypothetical protein